MSGILTLVATPIGNLGDITLRALETLKNCDVIACEDTRHSAILFAKYDIKKPLISYHKFNENEASQKILNLLAEGKNVALVSDAGMPCISDPGAIISAKAQQEGFEVTVASGASALLSAVALAGIKERGFCFLGFLPDKKSEREKLLTGYQNIDVPLVFYCSVHDINKDLDYFFSVLGDRDVCIARELSKKFETITRGKLCELRESQPKGEYVVIISPQPKAAPKGEPLQRVKQLIADGIDKKEAIKITARERGVPKDEIYKLTLDLK